jgi:putative glycosyltransferase (TIGR04372 family)
VRRLLTGAARGFAALVAVPVLVMAWCLRPLVRVRLCIVGSHRFGHLALEPEMWLAYRQSVAAPRLPRNLDVWSLGSAKVRSNQYLARLWEARLTCPPSWVVGALVRAGRIVPALALEQPGMSIFGPGNGLDVVTRQCPAPEPFTTAEVAALRGSGVDVTRPYVVLVVRDAAYYAARGESEDPNTALINGDVRTFIPACEYLVSVGLQVIRLGGPSPQKLGNLPGCLDYANSDVRTPALDVKLPMNCRFAIATQTGPDALALLGRRPVLYVDVLRFSQAFLGTSLATLVPVTFVDPATGRPWNLARLCDSPLLAAKYPREFAESGLGFVRADALEMRELVADYVDELENGVSDEVSGLRHRVNERLQQGMQPWGRERFGDVTARVSRRWLLTNVDWSRN